MTDEISQRGVRDLRAGDRDRERVAGRLREALVAGQLTLEEFGERLGWAYAATTVNDLNRWVADLPDGDPGQALVGGTPGRQRRSVALLGGSDREGRWVVPPGYTAVAMLGGVTLDMRSATFAEPVTQVRASAFLGGVRILVPPGVIVRVNGRGVAGGYGHSTDDEGGAAASPGAPVLEVSGVAMLGSVEVDCRAPRQPNPAAAALSRLRLRIRW